MVVELLKDAGDTVAHIWPLFVLVGAMLGGLKAGWRTVRRELEAVVTTQVAPVLKEVTPNGGGSLKDAVKRIEAKVDSMGVVVDEAAGMATSNNARLAAVLANLQAAYYEMNADGAVTSVNDSYLELYDISEKEALGSTLWRRHISPEDLELIDSSGALAMESHTEWYASFTVERNGVRIPVVARAKPIFKAGVFCGFSGAMTYDRSLIPRDSSGRAA